MNAGYGFLSENEAFANRLEEANVTFIGPSHDSIKAMGNKLGSKRLALQAKVNTIPGFDGVIPTADEAVRIGSSLAHVLLVPA